MSERETIAPLRSGYRDEPPFEAVCIGESMAVLVADPAEPLCQAATLRLDVGGAESNVASYLARLGVRVGWASRIGTDPLGELVRQRIAGTGVDVSLVAADPAAPTGVYFKDPVAGPGQVYYYRRGSAASSLNREVLHDVALSGCRLVHLSGITPALSQSCADLVAHALADRPVQGAVLSFDVNYRAALWPADEASAVLRRLANLADVVFVGMDEARVLWGARTPSEVRRVLDSPSTLVVKDGAVGVTSYRHDQLAYMAAAPVEVLEPTGAGDAYAAGYLFGLLRGMGESVRLRLGHRVAAEALRVVGDLGTLPSTTELLAEVGAHQEGSAP